MALSKWIELTAEGMQRLGHIKALGVISSPTRLTNFQGINIELSKLLRHRVQLQGPSESAQKYFATRKKPRGKDWNVEAQDAFLSDSMVPSQTGSLTDRTIEDGQIVNLAVALGLVRPKNFSLTPLGEVLRELIPEEELNAFRAFSSHVNPYVLDTAQKLFFLFCFLSSDGDVIRRLYPKLLGAGVVFHRSEAGAKLGEVFREMAAESKPIAKSLDDQATVRKWQEYAHIIETQAPTSHSGVREQRVTPRLEVLVDISWLRKDDPSRYSYRFTETGACFAGKLSALDDMEGFLQNSFFRIANECYGLGATNAEAIDEIIELALPSYSKLKSDLGYAPLTEMLLLASLRSIGSQVGRFVELRSGIAAIRAWQKEHPDKIRFSVDRRGHIRYVKLGGLGQS